MAAPDGTRGLWGGQVSPAECIANTRGIFAPAAIEAEARLDGDRRDTPRRSRRTWPACACSSRWHRHTPRQSRLSQPRQIACRAVGSGFAAAARACHRSPALVSAGTRPTTLRARSAVVTVSFSRSCWAARRVEGGSSTQPARFMQLLGLRAQPRLDRRSSCSMMCCAPVMWWSCGGSRGKASVWRSMARWPRSGRRLLPQRRRP